jgi:acyl-CoA reductase-like NAD-dependent aldehyde dehydrogenase
MRYRPIGVVGAITPWNWPLIIAIWQIAPSLRMGNTVVQKPSEYTTLCGLALVEVLNEVLPDGVLVPVTGAGQVGDALVRDKRVGKIMFTGSVRTGMKVVEASAGNLSRLTLELGGNDAGIVLPDVDPEGIAEGLFWGAFINNGQTCAALKRLYVPDSIYDQVVDALAAFTAKVPMGVGLDDANLLGPLQNQMQWNVVNRLVEDAKGRGAHLVMGGNPDPGQPGFFYPKTLVTDIDNDAPLVQEEQFGPALPIIRYTDLEQAVEWANAVDVGLGASVWSADRDKAKGIAARLEAGTVWINGHGGIHPMIPFGGAQKSGYGLEFGLDGLKSVAVPQVISG